MLVLRGPNTYFPLGAIARKQSTTALSTPEAELIAARDALKEEGIPALDLWEEILGKPMD